MESTGILWNGQNGIGMAAVTATAAHSGTRQGWWIPEEMDLHGVSLFPSPVHPHKAVYCADEDASTQARPSVVDAGTWDEGIKRKPSDQAVDEYEVMDDDFRSMSDTLTNALLVWSSTRRPRGSFPQAVVVSTRAVGDWDSFITTGIRFQERSEI